MGGWAEGGREGQARSAENPGGAPLDYFGELRLLLPPLLIRKPCDFYFLGDRGYGSVSPYSTSYNLSATK